MEPLAQIKAKLVALHPGHFQPDGYLARWCSPPIVRLLLSYGLLFQPEAWKRVSLDREYGPLDCHKNALHHATVHDADGIAAWFGFALYWEPGHGWLWWIHSWCVADGGTILDPAAPPITGPDQPTIFCGIPWGLELYRCLAPDFPADRLPPVLARSMHSVLNAVQPSGFPATPMCAVCVPEV